jgi:alginate O-acetyltransferase complex protein AlgI
MVFSSIVFLFYFLPIFLLSYFLIDKRYKNYLLLAASIFFYSWGAPRFIFVIIGTTILDFQLVAWMDRLKDPFRRKLLLCTSVSVNLGLLFYFKYSGFFVENLNKLLTAAGLNEKYWPAIVLPIGISFYTFETITYVVDVYRRVHGPLRSFRDYLLYIIFFPKLIAGPIVRYHELADQLTDRSSFENNENRITGFYRFVIGLAKKVIIANTVGKVADEVFAQEASQLGTITAWTGSLAYTFQIYFDFSGYSDMALGLSKMLGFRLPENFNNPYISQSITEFWRRWHITLGKWMKNYLYIPLGGNRVNSKARLYFNLWLVFLASGLWHGASWTFIFWGAYHGFFMVLERTSYGKFLLKIGRVPAMLITFLIVNIGWVFFRMDDLGAAIAFLKVMFTFKAVPSLVFDQEFYAMMIAALIFSFFAASSYLRKIQDAVYFGVYNATQHLLMFCSCAFLVIYAASSITTSSFNPFIYFRF